jgi:hypothetical protein
MINLLSYNTRRKVNILELITSANSWANIFQCRENGSRNQVIEKPS